MDFPSLYLQYNLNVPTQIKYGKLIDFYIKIIKYGAISIYYLKDLIDWDIYNQK